MRTSTPSFAMWPPLLAELRLLISDAAPTGSTGLSGWLDDNTDGFGPLVYLRAPAHHPEVESPADTAAPGLGEGLRLESWRMDGVAAAHAVLS